VNNDEKTVKEMERACKKLLSNQLPDESTDVSKRKTHTTPVSLQVGLI
jgi:hypothetical protein